MSPPRPTSHPDPPPGQRLAFDVEDLLRPISEAAPGGDPLAYSHGLRSRLSELRNPARSANPDDPVRDVDDLIDWHAIFEAASQALRETTKDLRVVCHLTEAGMHRFGLAGLRTGIVCLRRLCEASWDSLAPEPDPDDPEVRCAPLENLLDDPNHGPRLPTAVRALPILPTEPEPVSLVTALGIKDEQAASDLSAAIDRVPTETAHAVSSELDETSAELETLQHVLLERMGEYAPTFLHLRESLDLLRQWLDKVLEPQLRSAPAAAANNSSGSREDDSAGQDDFSLDGNSALDGDSAREDVPARELDPGDGASTGGVIRRDGAVGKRSSAPGEPDDGPARVLDRTDVLRADAYRQLTRAADVLRRIEPHSPIPYMVQRAVRLGQLPLPDLMAVIVRDESTLTIYLRELGLSGFAPESSDEEP